MSFSPDEFNILRKINNKPNTSQRDMAKSLKLSLGKINYCLNALKQKGLVKIKNFSKNTHRQTYIYYLTPKGISEKTRYTLDFMKIKMKEYDELKKELEEKKEK